MDAFILKNSHLMNTMHVMFKILIGTLFESQNSSSLPDLSELNSLNSQNSSKKNKKRRPNRDSNSAKLHSNSCVLVLQKCLFEIFFLKKSEIKNAKEEKTRKIWDPWSGFSENAFYRF